MGDKGMFGKSVFYEYTARVPLIVFLPDRRKGTIEQNVCLTEIFPTLCDWPGVGDLGYSIDGRSLVPLIKDRATEWDNIVFSEYYWIWAHRPVYMIKRDDLKYCYYPSEKEFFYDLQRDPDEMNNFVDAADY